MEITKIRITFSQAYQASNKVSYPKGDVEISLDSLPYIADAVYKGVARFTPLGNRDSRLLMVWITLLYYYQNIDQLAITTGNLQNEYNNLNTKVSTLQGNVTTLQNNITSVQNQMNAPKFAYGTATTTLISLLSAGKKNVTVNLSPVLPSSNYVVVSANIIAVLNLTSNLSVNYSPIQRSTDKVVLELVNKSLVGISGEITLQVTVQMI